MTLYGPLRTLSIISPFGSLSKTLEQPYRPRVFFFLSQISNEAHSTKKQILRMDSTVSGSKDPEKVLTLCQVILNYTVNSLLFIRPMSDFGKKKKKNHLYILNERDGQGLITNINCNIHRLFV